MRRRIATAAGPFLGLILLLGTLPSTGCEGFELSRFPIGDTVELYSLARADYIGQSSGFDFRTPQRVVVERPKDRVIADFDVVFSELEDGTPVLLPAGLFDALGVNPGLAPITGETFETLERAPGDADEYISDAAVPLEVGDLFAVRTRESNACRQYAKLEVLDLDRADGMLQFRFLRNNLCNDRRLDEVD